MYNIRFVLLKLTVLPIELQEPMEAYKTKTDDYLKRYEEAEINRAKAARAEAFGRRLTGVSQLHILDTLLPHRSILIRKGLERQSGRGTAIRTDSQAQMIGRTHILLVMAVISSTVSSVLSRFQAFSDLAFVVIE